MFRLMFDHQKLMLGAFSGCRRIPPGAFPYVAMAGSESKPGRKSVEGGRRGCKCAEEVGVALNAEHRWFGLPRGGPAGRLCVVESLGIFSEKTEIARAFPLNFSGDYFFLNLLFMNSRHIAARLTLEFGRTADLTDRVTAAASNRLPLKHIGPKKSALTILTKC